MGELDSLSLEEYVGWREFYSYTPGDVEYLGACINTLTYVLAAVNYSGKGRRPQPQDFVIERYPRNPKSRQIEKDHDYAWLFEEGILENPGDYPSEDS